MLFTLQIKNPENLSQLLGDVEMEHPNKLIDSFTGVVNLSSNGGSRVATQPNNILLRGTVLRNTDWAIGIVANTGHDTKIMMSSTSTKPKTSFLESAASSEIKRIVILLVLVCIAGASGNAIFNSVNGINNMWYLQNRLRSVDQWFVSFFYYFLLHATFIPVSLYVSMALVRSIQSFFMQLDLEMYYEPTDTPALVRTATLNEELGQISHIFSDKTGTLTCNIMDFRKCSINGVSYGLGITEIGKAAWKLQGKDIPDEVLRGEQMAKERAVPHVSFYDPSYEQDVKVKNEQSNKISNFFRFLAICHDVIPEKVDGVTKLSASNPDDEAIVCAADYFGYKFYDRLDGYIMLNCNGTVDNPLLIETLAFTSKRKRMSVVIRDSDGLIKVVVKGADTAMLPLLALNQVEVIERTTNDMIRFSIEGLRCLLVGYAVIAEDKFANWHTRYIAACSDLNEIDKLKQGLDNQIEILQSEIEYGLDLIGATALEDRLQDGVPECIASLAEAGIKIWVLTGDKEETAINITVACNLVLPTEYMEQVIINQKSAPTREVMIEIFLREAQVRR